MKWRSWVSRCLLAALTALVSLPLADRPASAVPHPSVALEADPDYRAARERIKARDFVGALPLLQLLLSDYADQAEVHSLIGFSLRKTGRYDEALRHYRRALELEADHLGANEYIGELFVETGRPDLAEEHLRKLRAVCGEECEETRDLAAAIANAKAAAR